MRTSSKRWMRFGLVLARKILMKGCRLYLICYTSRSSSWKWRDSGPEQVDTVMWLPRTARWGRLSGTYPLRSITVMKKVDLKVQPWHLKKISLRFFIGRWVCLRDWMWCSLMKKVWEWRMGKKTWLVGFTFDCKICRCRALWMALVAKRYSGWRVLN